MLDFWLCPYLSFAIKIKIKWPTECTMINSKSCLSPWHYQNSSIRDTWNPILIKMTIFCTNSRERKTVTPSHSFVFSIPWGNSFFPHVWCHLVLVNNLRHKLIVKQSFFTESTTATKTVLIRCCCTCNLLVLCEKNTLTLNHAFDPGNFGQNNILIVWTKTLNRWSCFLVTSRPKESKVKILLENYSGFSLSPVQNWSFWSLGEKLKNFKMFCLKETLPSLCLPFASFFHFFARFC